MQERLLGSFALRRNDFDNAGDWFLAEPVLECAGRFELAIGSFDYTPINLFDKVVAELFAQPGRGLAGPGEHQDPGHRLVEPVDDAEKHLAGFGVLLLDVRLDDPVHRLLGPAEMRARPPARLVHRDQVVVLVQDVEHVGEGHGRSQSARSRFVLPLPPALRGRGLG
jgi:hypothetical protein